MSSYNRIFEQFELCKSCYLKIDRFFNERFEFCAIDNNFEISFDNICSTTNHKIVVTKYNFNELLRFENDFRLEYTSLLDLIEAYNKKWLKNETELKNILNMKDQIEKYNLRIASNRNLINLFQIEKNN